MHKYLSAIGFSGIKKRDEYEKLIKICAAEATERSYTSGNDEDMITVFCKEFAPGVGISKTTV